MQKHEKFDRNYKLIFEIGQRDENILTLVPEQEIEVSMPFSLRFQTAQGLNLSNSGSCSLQLYNLSEEVQKALYKANFENKKYILMALHAGYQDTMPLIFYGFVNECLTYRKGGSTEYITDVRADNNSLIALYGFSNTTFTQGSDPINMIQELLKDTYAYTLGYVTPELKQIERDKTFIGQTLDLLGREYGDYNVYIDKNEINILGANDVIPADGILTISAESGLLGSPKRAGLFVEIEMLFEPRIKVGQAIQLISNSIPWFNQVYRVQVVEHSGIISPVQNGQIRTKLTLSLGETPFQELRKATERTEKEKPKNIAWQKPVASGVLSSNYGMRKHPTIRDKNGNQVYKFHDGIDIAVPIGTSVTAAAEGVISFTGWKGGYGKYIKINHGKDSNGDIIESFYGHLNDIKTIPGATVMKGQQIALSGNTAGVDKNGVKMTTGAHLHFGMHKNEKSINPAQYINV